MKSKYQSCEWQFFLGMQLGKLCGKMQKKGAFSLNVFTQSIFLSIQLQPKHRNMNSSPPTGKE